jgi:hypothetical protein
MKPLSPEQLAKIAEPLPPEAIAAHPRMAGLSTIKGIFVTERLNPSIRCRWMGRQDRPVFPHYNRPHHDQCRA